MPEDAMIDIELIEFLLMNGNWVVALALSFQQALQYVVPGHVVQLALNTPIRNHKKFTYDSLK